MNCIIQVPVKGYVKSYLEHTFGSPAKIDRSTILGKYLYRLLEDGKRNRDFEYRGYVEKVQLHIVDDIYLKAGHCLTPTSITEFNNFMEDNIRMTANQHIDNFIEFKGGMQMDGILSFQEKYNFSEEIYSFDTIKKNYYRYRQRVDKLSKTVSTH